MKKWIVLFFIVLIIGYGVTEYKADVDQQTPLEIEYDVQDELIQESHVAIQITDEQVYTGNLLLVNKDHAVPVTSKAFETVKLSAHPQLTTDFSLLDDSIRLTSFLIDKFSNMIEAAKNDGITHFMISSGYRDKLEQNQLFQEMGAQYALPAGYSEHNLGLSLDIGSTQGKMEHAAEGKWLMNHAWEHGFILRYPEDKTAITGIVYEPWHFRYVGLPHSAIMYDKDFVLEEYLDYLREQKSITATIDGQVYEIFYYAISHDTWIDIPQDVEYEISGDNMSGVIVTVRH